MSDDMSQLAIHLSSREADYVAERLNDVFDVYYDNVLYKLSHFFDGGKLYDELRSNLAVHALNDVFRKITGGDNAIYLDWNEDVEGSTARYPEKRRDVVLTDDERNALKMVVLDDYYHSCPEIKGSIDSPPFTLYKKLISNDRQLELCKFF
jgi:hypothetical protein